MVAVLTPGARDVAIDAPTRAAELAAQRARSGPGGPERAAQAARRFEGVLLQQMIQVLRKTTDAGGDESSGASQQYLSMFDEVLAERLSDGGGIGLARVIGQALGADPAMLGAVPTITPGRGGGLSPLTQEPLAARFAAMRAPFASAATYTGAAGALSSAAAEMSVGDAAQRWSRDGALTPADLASTFTTPTADGGVAAFNVRDANGFEGFYKCNLFALEAARRAGYAVPVQPRYQGWGYPNPDGVVRDAADGRLHEDWARVVTQEGEGSLVASGARGDRAFVLAGSGSLGHAGHMAVVERIRAVEYDAEGLVQRIVFDGWEARSTGAQHLEGRVWSRAGHPSPGARNGLSQIEVLELARPSAGETPETPTRTNARSSVQDRR
jgi:Rod binding domain-containing protein